MSRGSRCSHCRAMPGEGHARECVALRQHADARALWAVRVLDAYADFWESDPPHPVRQANGTFVVTWIVDVDGIVEERERVGATEDAARLAAAEAVFLGLPEAVRAELGERP